MDNKPDGDMQELHDLALNVLSSRAQLFREMADPNRDISSECGYPVEITDALYSKYYEREGVAKAIVDIYPDECWKVDPEVFETENEKETTKFEEEFKAVLNKRNIWHYLARVDRLSGIGRYGVLLLGFDDITTSEQMMQPVEGVTDNLEWEETESRATPRKLLYLRALDSSVVNIAASEANASSPRYGLPTIYDIQMAIEGSEVKQSLKVHWTRIIHVADNLRNDEVSGTPRMQDVFNRLYDLTKIVGGGAEMFWKGAFPGYSFEVNPEFKDATMDKEGVRRELENYSNGLQRYLALTGITAKSLAPQVADPSNHFKINLQYIAVAKRIPNRILMGTEEGKLAGGQDDDHWNDRIALRQNKHVSSSLIRPLVDRLILVGTLPVPESKEFFVKWPDMNATTDKEKAENGDKLTTAIQKYVTSGSDTLISPMEFFVNILKFKKEEAEAMIEATFDSLKDLTDGDKDIDAEIKKELAKKKNANSTPD